MHSYNLCFVPRYHKMNKTALPSSYHLPLKYKGQDLKRSAVCGRRRALHVARPHTQKIPLVFPLQWAVSPTSTSPHSDSSVLLPFPIIWLHVGPLHGTLQYHPLKKKILQRSDSKMQRERKIWKYCAVSERKQNTSRSEIQGLWLWSSMSADIINAQQVWDCMREWLSQSCCRDCEADISFPQKIKT